jgi:large subunit ribosomal protein L18
MNMSDARLVKLEQKHLHNSLISFIIFMVKTSLQKRLARHHRIRMRITGTDSCPRLAIYRSNASIYAQLIDDVSGRTLVSSSDLKLKSGNKIEHAKKVGADIAKKAIDAGIKTCVFDRGGFLYAGRVAALADAAREGGLKF